jgi:opacity protein-like surface antigen
MKRWIPWIFAASVIAFPAAAFGQGSFKGPSAEDRIGFTGTVHAGPSLLTQFDAPNQVGFNIDLYPGYQFTQRFVVELNAGFHSFKRTRMDGAVTVRDSFIPAAVPGIRVRFPWAGWFEPFVHSHFGLGLVRNKVTGSGTQASDTETTSVFTVNAGVGADFWVTDTIAVSTGVRYRAYFGNISREVIDFSAGASFRF